MASSRDTEISTASSSAPQPALALAAMPASLSDVPASESKPLAQMRLGELIPALQKQAFEDVSAFFVTYLTDLNEQAKKTNNVSVNYEKMMKVLGLYIRDIRTIREAVHASEKEVSEEHASAQFIAFFEHIKADKNHADAPDDLLNDQEVAVLLNILSVFEQHEIQHNKIKNKVIAINRHQLSDNNLYKVAKQYRAEAETELGKPYSPAIKELEAAILKLRENQVKSLSSLPASDKQKDCQRNAIEVYKEYVESTQKNFTETVDKAYEKCSAEIEERIDQIGKLNAALLSVNTLSDTQLAELDEFESALADTKLMTADAITDLLTRIDLFAEERKAHNLTWNQQRAKQISTRKKLRDDSDLSKKCVFDELKERYIAQINHEINLVNRENASSDTSALDKPIHIVSLDGVDEYVPVIACANEIESRKLQLDKTYSELARSILAIKTFLHDPSDFKAAWNDMTALYAGITTTALEVDSTFLSAEQTAQLATLSDLTIKKIEAVCGHEITLKSEIESSGYAVQAYSDVHRDLMQLRQDLAIGLSTRWKTATEIDSINHHLDEQYTIGRTILDEIATEKLKSYNALADKVHKWRLPPMPDFKDKEARAQDKRIAKLKELAATERKHQEKLLREKQEALRVAEHRREREAREAEHRRTQEAKQAEQASAALALRSAVVPVYTKPNVFKRSWRFVTTHKAGLTASSVLGASTGSMIGLGVGALIAVPTFGLSVPVLVALGTIAGAIFGMAVMVAIYVVCQPKTNYTTGVAPAAVAAKAAVEASSSTAAVAVRLGSAWRPAADFMDPKKIAGVAAAPGPSSSSPTAPISIPVKTSASAAAHRTSKSYGASSVSFVGSFSGPRSLDAKRSLSSHVASDVRHRHVASDVSPVEAGIQFVR